MSLEKHRQLSRKMSRVSEICSCLGCLILLYPVAFIIYCIVALFKIYGPLLLLVAILIYTPYMLIKSVLKK